MEISSRYTPDTVEEKWYAHWQSKGYFKSSPDDREPYTIVIPPPNVTGVLHMGHMLNNTIQDVLIRKARMDGKNACWVPGTDHASIATEAKVVRWLREEKNLSKADLGREDFLKYAWQWKEKYGGIILEQLQKLGASCDWDRTAFTMDEDRSTQVIRAFVDLYKKGKLYRDWRMVNWDPQAQTVLSNEEVIYTEERTNLYHVKYQVVGTEDFITIATTRPETILGDTAIAVHPDDDRYKHLHGTKALVPMVDREIPIIADTYVDQTFGTGALKITPAHDVNDYAIGKKHNLAVIDVLTDDGHMSEAAQFFVGDDLLTARKNIVKALKEKGQLERLEPYQHNVGRSERTHAVVEPRLSLQWYVDMKTLSKPAMDAVMTDEVAFFPKNQKNTYRHWMENIRDWCISRQLWWGHRIPAYYYEDHVFVAESAEEALAQAREKTAEDLNLTDLRQEEDVLDTWFSSWLWPFSVFNGLTDNEEVNYYYPTTVLVTGWDIIFLWVARMIMSGYEWKNERPFKEVYFTGMVRDQQRRKMSKSLGNSPDALSLIDKFGADGVRFGILSSSPAGGDLLFDEKLCEQGRNFCNKIWNAMRLIKSWEHDAQSDTEPSAANQAAVDWIEAKMNALLIDIDKDLKSYRLSDVQMKLYSFIWSDFCSWFLEMVKPKNGNAPSAKTYQKSVEIFSKLMQMLHPFMPFITEEVWHLLSDRSGQDCMVSSYPKQDGSEIRSISELEYLKEVVVKVRELRAKQGLKARLPLPLLIIGSTKKQQLMQWSGWKELLQELASIASIELIDSPPEGAQYLTFVVGTDKFYVEVEKEIDLAEEMEKAKAELTYQKGFVNSIRKKLDNDRFVNNAPEAVVQKERQKLADGEKRIAMLEESLLRLNSL
ncbi:MAG: valine--tRNA ligase [Saprospiraceae bacterium]|nr:valine--tRNA ligase [Saprospiraceae bacterium]